MAHRSERQSNISRIVRALLELGGHDQADLAPVLGISTSALSRRFSSGQWSVDDIDLMAEFFGRRISTFFLDPAEVLTTSEGGDTQGMSPTKWKPSSSGHATLVDA